MKIFNSGKDERQIAILMRDELVEFYFTNNDICLYWFSVDDWEKMRSHINSKTWFTPEMDEYINNLIND